MPPDVAPRRGDVVWVAFRDSATGEDKDRPALVVQDPRFAVPYPTLVVVAITSRMDVKLGATRVRINPGTPEAREMGLPKASVLTLDELDTVSAFRVWRVSGHCPFMDDVDRVLRKLLGLG